VCVCVLNLFQISITFINVFLRYLLIA